MSKVRKVSQSNHSKSYEDLDVVEEVFLPHMSQFKATTLIHGHTHKPGISYYNNDDTLLHRYILSDWDDTPKLLCYDHTIGIYFTQLEICEEMSNA